MHGARLIRAQPGVVQTRAAVAGVAVGMACGWNIANVGAVASTLADDYGVGLATVGLFTTALFAVHLALQIPGGRAADRFGARSVCIAALVVLCVANAVALVAPEPVLAFAARALCGLGTGLGFVSGSDYVRASGGSSLLQGIYGGGSVASPGLAVAIIPQLSPALGFRAPFATAIVVALLVLGLVIVAPETPRVPRHPKERAVLGLFRDPLLRRLLVVHAASFGLSVVAGNWVVTLLVKHGVARSAAAVAGSLILLLGFFTRAGGGWLIERHGERARAAVAASLVAAGAGMLVLSAPLPFGALVAAAAVVGLAAGLPFAFAFGGAAAARPDAPGAAVGFVNAGAALIILTGAPLLGLAFSLPGQGRIGFAALGILWMLAALATPRPRALVRLRPGASP